MGKHGKKGSHQHQQQRRGRRAFSYNQEEEEPGYSEPRDVEENENSNESEDEEGGGENDESNDSSSNEEIPSKFSLYEQSVQSPKGDISYLLKFFLMYVGGRVPLHLQEDFCGTALLSTEWLRTDARRTAVGLDLDTEALNWCMDSNLNKIGADVHSRISLFHGNVLKPLHASLVSFDPQDLGQHLTLEDQKDGTNAIIDIMISSSNEGSLSNVRPHKLMKDTRLPDRDIVCAFNYSCCCLHVRKELVLYFKHAINVLNKKGGIFVMDLYGGTSSECELRLQRRFPNFTYTWEQAEFDVVQRKTRISLHYDLKGHNKKLRHAFSYSWRLWSLPEIKDCMEEAGFRSVHFWIRNMPSSKEARKTDGFGVGRDIKYEEVTSFQQQDSWNAYIVGVV
ncbi:OLC1v1004563C1 [Oldenlandia corymbosa var. corymbosa]|uniref:OLC1v1004563C1 n=1 Tax=Oldenlandia corymbosa var. corymbosa TaxID=529605 RepID=A0AAV1DDU8_OLDCO|nr:OLC1v1004563C1 [Oldenlandia corymbosa var. corymbosa]